MHKRPVPEVPSSDALNNDLSAGAIHWAHGNSKAPSHKSFKKLVKKLERDRDDLIRRAAATLREQGIPFVRVSAKET